MPKGGMRLGAGRPTGRPPGKQERDPGLNMPGHVGAGRPKGSRNKRTDAKDALLKIEGVMKLSGFSDEIAAMGPLEVMSWVMRSAIAEGNKTLALQASAQLAPYLAPKLSMVTTRIENDPAKLSDQELDTLLRQVALDKLPPEPPPAPPTPELRLAA